MTDALARLAAALADRYRIERELGEGGMATVYLAEDLKHNRKVAIKVLKPELAAIVGAERFLAEIRTTANLQHPNILPLFDSGEANVPRGVAPSALLGGAERVIHRGAPRMRRSNASNGDLGPSPLSRRLRSVFHARWTVRVAGAVALTAAGLTLMRGQAVGQTLDSATVATAAERVMSKTTAALGSAPAPGCAVGVGYAGRPVYQGAFGMADLEFDIPNTPGTIFESGSVAKQFTAASIVALALQGKLRLDDPVRKYIPELPDYGAPLTLRNLLNHTSGIRDWGAVLALTGYGRGARLIDQDLALWVIEQQKAVDFTPGDEYSYSNSGYTLLSTIVERVSHQSLPDFTAEHFFQPLGMTHSSWRTDYTTLVPGRAQAYGPAGKGQWRLSMPFMNVYGNGGLLTTVGDWLKWNAMLDSRRLGGEDVAAMVDSLERQGRLNDGREITYALGLNITTYKGLREVAHGGATAGYGTYLTRLPGRKLSIAVMCNGPAPNPSALAHRLVDAIAGPLPSAPPPDTITVPAGELRQWAGLWREEARHQPTRIVEKNGSLTIAGRLALRPLRNGEFQEGNGSTRWRFESATASTPARATRSIPNGEEHFVKDTAWVPTPAELASFTGAWHSDEAATTFSLVVVDGSLVLEQRPDRKIPLQPQSRDLFLLGSIGAMIWFDRDAAGEVTTLHVGGPRMRDMRFAKQGR